ncbi:MAG: hypothetical protein R8G66_02220 [Cytophagales bacterium]|nr:hypothetical protein [Cytophagales bacterium]
MKFEVGRDLLIANYDCKTDVDDLHSVAAFATLLKMPQFKKLKYHAVAGTYGTQEGLYVPPNDLFQLAFDKNWSDAHANFRQAVYKVRDLALKTLKKKGHVWFAEGGQSDFSASVVEHIQKEITDFEILARIHVVQHSDWNEEVTTPENLKYVKNNIQYHKIPDGNAVGNGTPGFRSEEAVNWQSSVNDEELIEIWNLAIELGSQYNGKEGRYNNEAVAKGGLDFSDTCEIMFILGYSDLKDASAFFEKFGTAP